MKFCLLIGFMFFISGSTVMAHIVGDQPWCLVFSPFHQECTFDSESTCIGNMKKEATVSTVGDSRPIPARFDRYCLENNSRPKSFFDQGRLPGSQNLAP